jgi:hypothetical protein
MVLLPITVPHGFEIHVTVGDAVKVGTVLAKQTSQTGSAIPLSDALQIPPRRVAKYLKVKPGDSIATGDVLAEKKSLLSRQKVLSEVSGTVIGFERDNGQLFIKPEGVADTNTENLISPIVGSVTVCNNDQIVIETEKDILLGSDGIGTSSEGQVITLKEQNGESGGSMLVALNATIIDNILLVEESDRDVLLKAIGMGVKGIITGSITEDDMGYLMKRNIVTPVILVDQDALKKLTSWKGKQIHMNGQGKTIVLLHK